MLRFVRILLVAVVVVIAWTCEMDSVHACGPSFEIGLLSNRTKTMLELPDGVFMEEVESLAKLLPENSSDLRNAIAAVQPSGSREGGSEKERALYDEGAALYHDGKKDAARSAFMAVLALPAQERQYRSTWAAYMLGELSWPHPYSLQYYKQVRQLVSEGFRDDLRLAAASLGQEAYLHQQGLDDEWAKWFSDSGLSAPNLPTALTLYTEQIALGNHEGAVSLLFLVRRSTSSEADVREFASTDIGRSLLGIYLYTRRDELSDEEATLLYDILSESPPDIGSTRLAAAAYRDGRWQMAEKLATHNPNDSLSKWVLSKLALRAGDTQRSRQLLAEISLDASADFALCDEGSLARVSVENVIWALREGRALAAMRFAWRARLTEQVTDYIAERVLSVGELRVFIAGLPKPTIESEDESWEKNRLRIDAQNLKSLFARRLMRAGFRELQEQKLFLAWYHFQESQTFFAGEDKLAASKLADLLLRAHMSTDSIVQADALYRASRIARVEGLEVLGTSDAPDWASQYAQFDMTEYWSVDSSVEWKGEKERNRLIASAPLSSQRYHYRQLASKLAEQAADLLPEQSHAFAATLCHATRYIFNTDRARVGHLWSRYVRDGPAVDFSGSFGIHCPEPQFVAARKYQKEPPGPKWPWLVGALLGIFALAALAWRFRRTSIHRGPIGDLDKFSER